MKYFLGIDTSNYRTSAAICDENGTPVKSVRRLLSVKDGERGLRQSDALFAHVKALPEIMKEIGSFPLHAVGYSKTPRDCEGSYMPCFLAGEAVATGIAELLGVPLYPFSHQAGHLAAAIYSCNKTNPSDAQNGTEHGGSDAEHEKTGAELKKHGAELDKYDAEQRESTGDTALSKKISESGKFIAFHLSGGTTEALLYDKGKITLLGGTLDINAGQLIDRVGVMLGLKFPAGEEMEKLSNGLAFSKGLKISVKGFDCNLAGAENIAKKLYEATGSREITAAFAIDTVCKTVDKMTENIISKHPSLPVLYAGGVMACKRIQNALKNKYDCYFAEPEYSGDNAVGTARLCRSAFLSTHTIG